MKLSNRARSPSHDPAKHAIWTPESFSEELEHFCTDVFPVTPHEGCIGLPGELFARSLAIQGERPVRFIGYDESFRVLTMPLHDREPTIFGHKGIRVLYFRYWADEFRDARLHRQRVSVRFDPGDASFVMALLPTGWVRCECVSPIVRGCSWRDIEMFSLELRAEAKQVNRQKRVRPIELERFIARVRAREIDLDREKQARLANSTDGSGDSAEATPPDGPSVFDLNGAEFKAAGTMSREI